ncbi:MAG: DUF5666 domain-containing protein [Burkholderiaceae bacterium]
MSRALTITAAGMCAVAALAACGGGTEGTGAVPEPVGPLTSRGTMKSGSVILNGIRFDVSAAAIRDDRNRTATQLADGMVVKLRGRTDDGINGRADLLKVENEVRARITAIQPFAAPPRMTVGGLDIALDANTVYANFSSFDTLTVGTRVEVHGLRDSTGLMRASRIEIAGSSDGSDELRGAVSALDPTARRFVLNGTVTVDFSAARFEPAGAGADRLANGALVEVRGSLSGTTLAATEIVIDALQDAVFAGDPGEPQEVEGYVSSFTVHPGTFRVGGRAVSTTSMTRFSGGNALNLANDVRVEVEGTVDRTGVLVVAQIKYVRARVVLEGLASAVDVAARTLTVLNQTLTLNDLTSIDAQGAAGRSNDLADIRAGIDCVDVEGFMEGSVVVVDQVKEEACDGRSKVQAHVTAKDEESATLTFFNTLRADLSGALLFDHDDRPLTKDQFFAAIRVAGPQFPGTLVEVKGRFNGTTLTADEAELEE